MKNLLAILLMLPLVFSCDSSFEEMEYKELNESTKQLVTFTVGVNQSVVSQNALFSASQHYEGFADKYDYVVYNKSTLEFIHRQVGSISNGEVVIADRLPKGDYLVVFLLVDELDKNFKPSKCCSDEYCKKTGEIFQHSVDVTVGEKPQNVEVRLERKTGALVINAADKDMLDPSVAIVKVTLHNLPDKFNVGSGVPANTTVAMEKVYSVNEWVSTTPFINVLPTLIGETSFLEVTMCDAYGNPVSSKLSSTFTVKKGEVVEVGC